MKIKLYETSGNLNPLPVMGKDAFISFAKEWCDYVSKLGLYPDIQIPTLKYFRKYFDKNGGTSYLNVGVPVGRGIHSIACMKGYCENPHVRVVGVGITDPFHVKRTNSVGVETLKDSNLSNIIFEGIVNLQSYGARKLDESIAKTDNINVSVKELLDKTNQMIYSRSALLHRELFGGYHL